MLYNYTNMLLYQTCVIGIEFELETDRYFACPDRETVIPSSRLLEFEFEFEFQPSLQFQPRGTDPSSFRIPKAGTPATQVFFYLLISRSNEV